MKPISDDHRKRLLVELHRILHASASEAVAKLGSSLPADVTYPPNGELGASEEEALRLLKLDGPTRSGLTKVIADAIATTAFHFFCVMDAVGDPEDVVEEPWLRAELSEPDEEEHPMLHDAFFETYWDYKEANTGE